MLAMLLLKCWSGRTVCMVRQRSTCPNAVPGDRVWFGSAAPALNPKLQHKIGERRRMLCPAVGYGPAAQHLPSCSNAVSGRRLWCGSAAPAVLP